VKANFRLFLAAPQGKHRARSIRVGAPLEPIFGDGLFASVVEVRKSAGVPQ